MTDRPKIAVLDYGIGTQKAMERVGAEAELTADPGTIEAADGVILFGVGNFGACMRALVDIGLADQAMKVAERSQPFLGICVGMQMMFAGSDESPEIDGLGLLPGRIEWLPDTVKRPQVRWKQLTCVPTGDGGAPNPVLDGLDGAWVYFVHSLAPVTDQNVIATTTYGGPVVAAVARDNVYATQFHPKKSAAGGLRLLTNFLACCR